MVTPCGTYYLVVLRISALPSVAILGCHPEVLTCDSTLWCYSVLLCYPLILLSVAIMFCYLLLLSCVDIL